MSDATYYLRAALDWIDAVPDEVAAALPAMPGFNRDDAEGALRGECADRVRISKDGSTAIDPDYYWRDIDGDTPRGVKLQLLTEGGVAVYGQITGKGDDGFTRWAPLPKQRKTL